jgi:hypothetical protein
MVNNAERKLYTQQRAAAEDIERGGYVPGIKDNIIKWIGIN